MISEIDYDLFAKHAKFYVYKHARPDGRIFYVGKGSGNRAWNLAPSKRGPHHAAIVKKYGRYNIKITTIPCLYEAEALGMEKAHIVMERMLGSVLTNVTEGGRGVIGPIPINLTEKRLKALELGRGEGHFKRMSSRSQQRILEGLAKGRIKTKLWMESPEGLAHQQKLVQAAQDYRDNLKPWEANCSVCSSLYMTKSHKSLYCPSCKKDAHKLNRRKVK